MHGYRPSSSGASGSSSSSSSHSHSHSHSYSQQPSSISTPYPSHYSPMVEPNDGLHGTPAHYSPSASHSSSPHDPLQWRTYTLGAHLNYPFQCPESRSNGTQDGVVKPATASQSSRWASAPTTTRNTRSPSPNMSRYAPPQPSFPSTSTSRSRARSEETSDNGKVCSHCLVTSTPLWRKHPSTKEILCNACGLYILEHGKLRPPELIESDIYDDEEEDQQPQRANPGGPDSGKECSHCGSRSTSTWRRDKETKELLCNACGVYLQLRGEKRPLRLKKNKFKPRPSKLSPAPAPEVRVFHW